MRSALRPWADNACVPVRSVYFTSGPDRFLRFRAHRVELRHAPSWQLTAPNRSASTVIRVLAWLGPNEVEKSLDAGLPCSREKTCANFSPRGWSCPAGWRSSSAGAWHVAEIQPVPVPARSPWTPRLPRMLLSWLPDRQGGNRIGKGGMILWQGEG